MNFVEDAKDWSDGGLSKGSDSYWDGDKPLVYNGF